MSSSKGWSIFAILVGISGLALSGYTLLVALPEQTQQGPSGFQNVWYDYYGVPTWVYNYDIILPNLSIIATVNPNESLHVLFQADVHISCDGGPEWISVFVNLNGSKVAMPHATVGGWHDHGVYGHITLQYSNLKIIPGVYNISIIATSTDSINPNTVSHPTLLVFTSKQEI